MSNAYYIMNALKIKDDKDLKFTIIATAGVSLLFQVVIAILLFVDHVFRLSRNRKQCARMAIFSLLVLCFIIHSLLAIASLPNYSDDQKNRTSSSFN